MFFALKPRIKIRTAASAPSLFSNFGNGDIELRNITPTNEREEFESSDKKREPNDAPRAFSNNFFDDKPTYVTDDPPAYLECV